MKLSQCKHGILVCTKLDSGEVEFVGMVVGVGESLGSPVPVVQWQYQEEPTMIHPELLYLYED